MRSWMQRELNATHGPSGSGTLSRLTGTDEKDNATGDPIEIDFDFEDWENSDPNSIVRSKKRLFSVGSQSVLCAITAFRKMYNHPALLFKYLEPTLRENNTRVS